MSELLRIIAELGIELHPDRIDILANAIAGMTSLDQFALIKPKFGPGIAQEKIQYIDETWKRESEFTPIQMAAALRGASAASQEMNHRGKTEIVWSGPSLGQIPVRHTEQVLCEVINSAKRKLFMVSFVAYEIDTVIKAIRNAIGRNVQIDLLLEQSIKHGGRVSQDSGKLIHRIFPTVNIYYWNSEKTEETGISGAVHAKCAVADGEIAFITSANLTNAAMEKNMELGVVITGGTLPFELHSHLESLIKMKIIAKVE